MIDKSKAFPEYPINPILRAVPYFPEIPPIPVYPQNVIIRDQDFINLDSIKLQPMLPVFHPAIRRCPHLSVPALLMVLFSLLFLTGKAQDGPPTPEQVRAAIAGEIKGFNIKPVEIGQVIDTKVAGDADSIAVRVYIPSQSKGKQVIYNIHGGALIAGDLDTHDNISRVLASRTGAVVVAVHYRRPPESPYPAGLDDCVTVLSWIRLQAGSWGADPRKLVLLGDSGGGLFAASLLVKTNSPGVFSRAVFINPAVDLRTPGEGMYGMVTQLYLGGRSADDSVISPITAGNYRSFPASLVVTCGRDELKPHGDALSAKLKSAGVAVKELNLPEEDHLGGLWSAAHPRAQLAIDAAVDFIKSSAK